MKKFIQKHKNLFLFSLLVLALILTYLFEERSNREALSLENKKSQILNTEGLGELTGVKGIKLDIEKKGDHFFSRQNGILLRQERMDEFFKLLSNIKVKTTIAADDVEKVGRGKYIPDDSLKLNFQFEKGGILFTLGKKLDYDQSFYMEITRDGKTQMVIAYDDSPDPGAYKSDKEYQTSDLKFKRMQVVFMLTNIYFYDTRVFKDLYTDEKKINFERITISTFRNKKFTLNFKETKTDPPAPSGIAYFEDNWISFHKFLTHLEGRTLISPYEPSVLDEVLSQFQIFDREGRSIELTLYKKFGEQNGYFLTSNLDKLLYVIKPEDSRFFFVNVQDFWKKSIAMPEGQYQLGLTFFDNKTENVKIYDKELFKVESLRPQQKVRNLEFKKLVDFIKMEGDHVSELSEKPQDILKKSVLRLNLDNKVLSVILEDNDAVLIDHEHKLKIHHYVGATLPFSIKRTDYFE